MMGWPLVSREGLVSQRGRCGVHHLPAITDCWHVVRGRSWGRRNNGVSLAGDSFCTVRKRNCKTEIKAVGRFMEIKWAGMGL